MNAAVRAATRSFAGVSHGVKWNDTARPEEINANILPVRSTQL